MTQKLELFGCRDAVFTDENSACSREFNRVNKWVQFALEPDDHSHLIDSEHMAHVRLTKQYVVYQDCQFLKARLNSSSRG